MTGRLNQVSWIPWVAALAVCGLLVMHGFEAVLLHSGDAGPSHHDPGVHLSSAERRVQNGTCDLESPRPEPELQAAPCPSGPVPDRLPVPQHVTAHPPWSLANRAVLTAWSILRL